MTTMPDAPAPVSRAVLSDELQSVLDDDEVVFYWGQPIRFENGMGVWLIFALGLIFVPGASLAFADFFGRLLPLLFDGTWTPLQLVGATVLLVGVLLLLAFGVLLAFWPLLTRDRLNRTHVLVSDRRVLHVVLHAPKGGAAHEGKQPTVRLWRLTQCSSPKVVRRRRNSATLLLGENTKEKLATGKMVYEWQAVHGIPRATEALHALRHAQSQADAAAANALRAE